MANKNSSRYWLGAFATTVICFALLVFLWPVNYTYKTSWSCPQIAGVHSCPAALTSPDGKSYEKVSAKGPLIGGFHAGGSFPRPAHIKSFLFFDAVAAVVLGTISWVVLRPYWQSKA